MGASGQNLDVGMLLREIGWLRRLAATLVGDTTRADDLTQDTLVAALERRPWAAGAGSLRPWLSAVARKIVRHKYRDSASRAELEHRAIAARDAGGAPDLVERVDLQRRLVEAVLGLDEPYRSAVLLRYFQGLSAQEIAARQGCNAEAARQRVSRGLSMLRARLDRAFDGGRGAWCAVFAARFGLDSFTGTAGAGSAMLASSTAIGGGLMTTKAVGVGIALAALAVVAWIELRDEPVKGGLEVLARDPIATGSVKGAVAEPMLLTGEPESDPPSAETFEREVVGTGSHTLLRGTVLDARGNGIPDVRVRLEGLEPTYKWDPFGRLIGGYEGKCAHTNGQGAFEWELDEALGTDVDHWLLCDHEDYFPGRVAIDLAHETNVVLDARPAIEGQFLDPDRHPVSGPAEAFAQMRPRDEEVHQFRMDVDADGRFHSHGLPEGELDLVHGRVRGLGAGYAQSKRSLAAEDRIVLDIVLSSGKVVRGVVLTEGSREPIAGAAVFAEAQDPNPDGIYPSTTSDSQGRFELQGVEASTFEMSASRSMTQVYEVEARKPGYVFPKAWRESIRLSPTQQSTDPVENLEVFLQPVASRVTVRLSHPSGEPVTQEFAVIALSEGGEQYEANRENEDRHVFAGLPLGKVCIVAHTLRGVEEEERFLGSAVVEIGSDVERDVGLVLEPAEAIVEGAIRDTDGNPVAGATLRTWSEIPFGQRTYGIDSATATTDDRGRYQFAHLYPGLCDLQVERTEIVAGLGFLPARQMLEIGSGELLTEVDIRAAPSIRVEGRIEPWGIEDAMDPPLLLLSAPQGQVGAAGPLQDGHFAFEGVFPATYELRLMLGEKEVARMAVGPESRTDLVLHVK